MSANDALPNLDGAYEIQNFDDERITTNARLEYDNSDEGNTYTQLRTDGIIECIRIVDGKSVVEKELVPRIADAVQMAGVMRTGLNAELVMRFRCAYCRKHLTPDCENNCTNPLLKR